MASVVARRKVQVCGDVVAKVAVLRVVRLSEVAVVPVQTVAHETVVRMALLRELADRVVQDLAPIDRTVLRVEVPVEPKDETLIVVRRKVDEAPRDVPVAIDAPSQNARHVRLPDGTLNGFIERARVLNALGLSLCAMDFVARHRLVRTAIFRPSYMHAPQASSATQNRIHSLALRPGNLVQPTNQRLISVWPGLD